MISFPSSTLYHEDPIVTAKSTILNMTMVDEPIPLSRDENGVRFLDGEGFEGASDKTLSDAEDGMRQFPPSPDNQCTYEVEPVNISLPVHLPENDSISKSKVAKIVMLKLGFGWKHWRTGRGYVQQKKNSGGDTHSYNVARHASLSDCQQIALNLFFPNSKSQVGPVENMSIAMGNFSGKY